MARTMIMDSKLTDIFWTQEVHTTVHIQNRVMLKNNTDKTPYELKKGRPANAKHFRVFGRKCYIKREYGRMGKFESRVDKGILVGYSSTRKTYNVFDPGDQILLKIQSARNRFKSNESVGLIVTNPTQLVWVQMDVGSERYRVLFKMTNRQKKGMLTVQSVRLLTWQSVRHVAELSGRQLADVDE
jgi:hypothetical protein